MSKGRNPGEDSRWGLTSPDDNVRHAVEVFLRVVQVDCVLESDAGGDTGKHAQAQQEGNGDLGISVELDVPEQGKRSASPG